MKRPFSTLSLLCVLILVSFAPKPSRQTSAPIDLKIMTYNIHHGNPPDQPGVIDIEAIAKVILEKQPDLVALQEVDVNTRRSGGINEIAELSAKTGYPYSYFGKSMDYDGGQYGIAILSKYKLSDTETHLLPFTPGHGEEPRVLATATIVFPNGRKIKFGSTHLDFQLPETQVKQVLAIQKISRESKLPFIFAGDLNAAPESLAIQTLDQYFKKTCTQCPSTFSEPGYKSEAIDYIAFKPSQHISVISHQVYTQDKASDHFPVMATLKLK